MSHGADQRVNLSMSSLWCEKVKDVLFTLTKTYDWPVSITIEINNNCEINKYSRGLIRKQQLEKLLEIINNKECFWCL